MKNLILITGCLFLSASAYASEHKGCASKLVYDRFIDCDEGLNGPEDKCTVIREKLGEIEANLSVKAVNKASANLLFKDVDGKKSKLNLRCALTTANGDVNDMECVSERAVNKKVGKLALSFNSLEAPYFVAVFSEFSNAPIGNFSTEDCKR